MSRNYLFLVLVGIVVLVLQTTVWKELSDLETLVFHTSLLTKFRPDLIFALVVLIGLFRDPIHGAIMAFGLGYLQDVVLGETMGIYMTDRMIVFILAHSLTRWFMATSSTNQFVCALGLGVVDKLALLLLVGFFGGGFSSLVSGLHFRFFEVLINAGLVTVMYIPLSWVPGLFQEPTGIERRQF